MPRYVILEHDHPTLHWDFMLEAEGVLRTWRLSLPPKPGERVTATSTFDHRLHYLDYEGPVSNDRGTVHRWDAGVFEWLEDGPERIVVLLAGRRLQGTVRLDLKEGGLTFAAASLRR